MENWKRILIAFLPILQHSIYPLLHKEGPKNKYRKEDTYVRQSDHLR
jgi:hypothetical protein